MAEYDNKEAILSLGTIGPELLDVFILTLITKR